jgi:hypothetical protein
MRNGQNRPPTNHECSLSSLNYEIGSFCPPTFMTASFPSLGYHFSPHWLHAKFVRPFYPLSSVAVVASTLTHEVLMPPPSPPASYRQSICLLVNRDHVFENNTTGDTSSAVGDESSLMQTDREPANPVSSRCRRRHQQQPLSSYMMCRCLLWLPFALSCGSNCPICPAPTPAGRCHPRLPARQNLPQALPPLFTYA